MMMSVRMRCGVRATARIYNLPPQAAAAKVSLTFTCLRVCPSGFVPWYRLMLRASAGFIAHTHSDGAAMRVLDG